MLLESYPDSLSSLLLARTMGVVALDQARAHWEQEVLASGRPWVRPLQPLPVPEGRLASLWGNPTLPLRGLGPMTFVDEDTLAIEPAAVAPDIEARTERVVWRWRTTAIRIEPCPAPLAESPFENEGWGPAYLRRADGTRVRLPLPADATADAREAAHPGVLLVYGSHDEYDGGFIWLVERDSLRVLKKIETATPVHAVHQSADGATLVARTSAGIVVVRSDQQTSVAVKANAVALSPSAEHLAVRTPHNVEIWRLRHAPTGSTTRGFPPRFSPDGQRLLRGKALYDGLNGQLVAPVETHLGSYLEGGPADPWVHLGNRYLISLHSLMNVWDGRTGAVIASNHRLRFPHWYSLAYDQAGEILAVVRHGGRTVQRYALPSGDALDPMEFNLGDLERVALSPSGRLVAVSRGAEFEIRTTSGELLRAGGHPGPPDGSDRRWSRRPSLSFPTESTLASYIERDGWREFDIAAASSRSIPPAGLPNVHVDGVPPHWTITRQGISILRHESTRTEVAFPLLGECMANPKDPTILATEHCHVQLSADERRADATCDAHDRA